MNSYTLEIILDGKPSTFKIAAESPHEANKGCVRYFNDPDIPDHLHKSVAVLNATAEKWTPAGFPK